MELPALRGRSILVVDDEMLIGMHIRRALEDAGALVTATTTVRHALILVEHDRLAAAIMHHALADGDSTGLGFEPVQGASPDAPFVSKPAGIPITVAAYWGMTDLLLNLPRWAGAAEAAAPRSLRGRPAG
jgi:CheY-like chemotaxis protein